MSKEEKVFHELNRLLQGADIHNGPYTDTVTIIFPSNKQALAAALTDKLKELKEY